MNEYKKLGLKSFVALKFSLASMFFSLAYELENSGELLFLINLCHSAKKNQEEALMLFDFYKFKFKSSGDIGEFMEILDTMDTNDNKQKDLLQSQKAISYAEFGQIVKNYGNFKLAFENIMFSTKILIANREDLMNFLNDLVDNGFVDMSLSYLETAINMYGGDERLEIILKKIQKYENRNFK